MRGGGSQKLENWDTLHSLQTAYQVGDCLNYFSIAVKKQWSKQLIKESVLQASLKFQMVSQWPWGGVMNPNPSDTSNKATFPPTRPYLLTFSKQFNQLLTMHSNIRAYRSHSHSNYHSVLSRGSVDLCLVYAILLVSMSPRQPGLWRVTLSSHLLHIHSGEGRELVNLLMSETS